ncbi:MAG: hypothetical protein GX111_11280 [Clostridiales bacterium]|jgi:hypothetical protein|nr:hypothetical protein [Clostridiales bacterium]
MMVRPPHRKEETPAILSVTPVGDHRLLIALGSGSFMDLNLRHCMYSNRYYNLNNPELFRGVFTDGYKIIFAEGDVFTPDIFPRQAINMALRTLPTKPISFLRVQPMENSRIQLEMATESILILNMEEHLRTGRYGDLPDDGMLPPVKADGADLLIGDLRVGEDELTYLMLSTPTGEF